MSEFAQERAAADNEFAAMVFLPLTRRGPVTISPAAPAGRHASDISVARGSQSRSWAQAGECPERQRGRTVNPLAMPSQVRVLLPPPSPIRTANRAAFSGVASQVVPEIVIPADNADLPGPTTMALSPRLRASSPPMDSHSASSLANFLMERVARPATHQTEASADARRSGMDDGRPIP